VSAFDFEFMRMSFNFGHFWSQVKLSEPTSVLSYLGIQRRPPGEENPVSPVSKPEPKAKKSFRPFPTVRSDHINNR
jgi:hypothetical protein